MKQGAEEGHELLQGLDLLRQTLESQIEGIRATVTSDPALREDSKIVRLRRDLAAFERARSQGEVLNRLLNAARTRCRRSYVFLVRGGDFVEWPRDSGSLAPSDEWDAILQEERPLRFLSGNDETALVPFVLRGRTAAVIALQDDSISELPLDEVQILCHGAAQSMDLMSVREGQASALEDVLEATTVTTDDAILAAAIEPVEAPESGSLEGRAPSPVEDEDSDPGEHSRPDPSWDDADEEILEATSDDSSLDAVQDADGAATRMSSDMLTVMEAVEFEGSETPGGLPATAGDLSDSSAETHTPIPADLENDFDPVRVGFGRASQDPADRANRSAPDGTVIGEADADDELAAADPEVPEGSPEAPSVDPVDSDGPGKPDIVTGDTVDKGGGVDEALSNSGRDSSARGDEGTANPEISALQDTLVQPPGDLAGPGSAFSSPHASGDEVDDPEQEARRLARLLVSEIELYNRDELQRGRLQGDILTRLSDDIDRARAIYEERTDARIRLANNWFDDELVAVLAQGDAGLLGSRFGS